MPLLPEPIFYQTIKRDDGARRKLIYITNSEESALALEVTSVEKPEWVEIEEIFKGAKIEFPSGKRTPVIVNLNTGHRFFPHGKSMDEAVKVQFSGDMAIEIPISIQSIQEGVEDFRGVFAMDFGTTNTCYAYKGKLDEYQDAYSAQKTHSSPEIPTLIFFKDVSSTTNPKYLVGNSAKQEIQEFGWQTYSYFQSIKRDLGRDDIKVVMDQHAAEGEGHRQQWHVEDIAAFIVRDIITKAQKDIGQRVLRAVATYPVLFTMHQKEALTRVYQKAFTDLGIEIKEDTVTLDLDETNAAAFNYIFGTMLNEMKGLSVREKKATLLSYDFGGGTIDVSLIDIHIKRDDIGRINIRTEVQGLTGERFYGGDNVTLDVMKVLKKKTALVVAKKIMENIETSKNAVSKKEEEKDSFFGGGFGGGKEEEDDMFGGDDQESAEDTSKAVAAVEEDPELAEIESFCAGEDRSEFDTAAELVGKYADVVKKAVSEGKSITDAFLEWEEESGQLVSREQSERKAEQLENAVEALVPTKYASYENVSPKRAELARRLFFELWQESDVLKIRLSNSGIGRERVASEFKRTAKYTCLDKIAFTEIDMTIEELEAAVARKIRSSIEKAYNMYKSTMVKTMDSSGKSESSSGGLVISGPSGSGLEISGPNSSSSDYGNVASGDEKELRILLAGNGARLPVIRRQVKEIFGVDDSRIVMDKGQIKTGTARGAAEEYYLRRAFGKTGIITYDSSGFLNKIPYTIGMYQPELEFIGYENGFCPVFRRGTKINTSTTLSGSNNPLIFQGMEQLTLFADYHDGSPPYLLGWFDFTKPMEADAGAQEGQAAPPADDDPHHKIEVVLLPSRLPQARDPKTGKKYKFFARKEVWKPEENPFSGAH